MARKKSDKLVETAAAPAPEFLLGGMDEVDAPKEPLRPVEAVTESKSSRPARTQRESTDRRPPVTPPVGSAPPSTPPDSKRPSPSYTVLARRYRSRDFNELIGQEPIARTLKNAIASGRTAHAYLFTGTRGVGKTSMARIFAKALNVSDDLSEKDQIADAILRGDDLDVIEIDGASNRGIDQARDLIANAGMTPARCRYKIYIIDEVHALTKDAFNALLKLMEEPPSHVKFILCTTEPHKVPATIQSRCQRFDFRAIPTARIAEQIRLILTKEGIEAEDEGIAQVARMGHGSMRDALSILDCVLASGDRRLTAEQVTQSLGLPEHALVARIVDAIAAGDSPGALQAGAELLARGSSVEQALETLVGHLRDLMIAAACGVDSELLELSAESRKLVGEQAAAFDTPALVYMIALCESVARQARGATAARALFDAALVRLCLTERLASIPALLGDGASGAMPATRHALPGNEKKKLQSAPLAPAGPAESPGRMAELKPQPAAVSALIETLRTAPPSASAPADWTSLWRTVVAAAVSDADRARLTPLRLVSNVASNLRFSIDPSAAAMAGWLRTQRAWLESFIKGVTGRPVSVEFSTAEMAPAATHVPRERLVDEALQLPAVRRAMAVLEASVVDVSMAPPPAFGGERAEAGVLPQASIPGAGAARPDSTPGESGYRV